jgi:hypothetical protein
VLMTIPRMFNFHTKRKHELIADLYIIEKMWSVKPSKTRGKTHTTGAGLSLN